MDLSFITEPNLLFRHDQPMLDPRDGLSLFGPLDRAKPEGIRWGVVGLKESITRLKKWVARIEKPVVSGGNLVARPLFPGFEAAFRCKWVADPVIEMVIPNEKLHNHAFNADRYQRVYRTVDLFSSRIKKALRSEDVRPDVWFVVIPEYVYSNCRPMARILPDARVHPEQTLSPKRARRTEAEPFLFKELNVLAQEYLYEVNFHHQLKARLLDVQAPVQIVRETTIAPRDFFNKSGAPLRDLEADESAIAWNLATAAFYKAGGRPWKLGAARPDVCYVGIVFKIDEKNVDNRTACCGAQMFLDSGDGVVFKGAVGPWYRGKRGMFHLDRKSAREISEMCVAEYSEKTGGRVPAELFVHGKISLNDDEWSGFQEGAGSGTRVIGVKIRPDTGLKLFRLGSHPILRGSAYSVDSRSGYLWTKGMTPRLRTYAGREVPNPLWVEVCRGEADISTVMEDVLALTKLNYNSCKFGDGVPVTLKFANAVGDILTAGPSRRADIPPLPFKFYI